MKRQYLQTIIVSFIISGIIYSCSTPSCENKIKEEQEKIIVATDSIQKILFGELINLEKLIDKTLEKQEVFRDKWRSLQQVNRTIGCIDDIKSPFISHCSMTRDLIRGNQSSILAFASSFKAFVTNNQDTLNIPSYKDLVTISIPSTMREVDRLIAEILELGAQYEILCKIQE